MRVRWAGAGRCAALRRACCRGLRRWQPSLGGGVAAPYWTISPLIDGVRSRAHSGALDGWQRLEAGVPIDRVCTSPLRQRLEAVVPEHRVSTSPLTERLEAGVPEHRCKGMPCGLMMVLEEDERRSRRLTGVLESEGEGEVRGWVALGLG